MILADKIIELRKLNNWSQEELAEMIDVSRQSISKWESAQSVPDMNRILRLSEVFGVSTDYLLKDEIESEETRVTVTDDTAARRVSMEEASAFLDFRNRGSGAVALGVMMCILSPILLIFLGAAQEAGKIALTENQAAGIGLIVLILLVGGAVAIFVVHGISAKPYEYLEKELIETAYGVDGMARERRERYKPAFAVQLTAGIVLCVLSVIPIFIAMLFPGENDYYAAGAVAVTLLLVAVGVFLIVRASIVWGSFQILLEEGDYTKEQKLNTKKNELLTTIYWAAVTAGYLGYSFLTMDWGRSWIVWPVAGVCYALVSAVASALRKKA